MSAMLQDDTGIGLSGSEYAKANRQFMDLINQIRSTGAALDVDLPSIVVAGNQSSGKSSLIEAISGINLPRAAGTCTRVPMEVRLKQTFGKPWSCSIALRQETDEHGNALQNIAEVPFGPILTNPSEVEVALRRAQLAILNPSVSAANFVNYSLPTHEEPLPLNSRRKLAFSKNVVCLSIQGPEVTDLTLLDLPGIIQSVGRTGDMGNIDLVIDLVDHYIRKDCLILLVITMKDDIQNQKAVMLASKADPEGRRTIGVLTKVDTLQGAETREWLPIVKNEKEQLLHGYHITRQPNADELNDKITFPAARAKETAFFQSAEPWASLPEKFKKRQGTQNLTAFLSHLLVCFIKSKLPTLIGKINDSYDAVQRQLRDLPPPPSNDPATEMLTLLSAFHGDLQAIIKGSMHFENLIQALRQVYDDFESEIWSTAPVYLPHTKKELVAMVGKDPNSRDVLSKLVGMRQGQSSKTSRKRKYQDIEDVRNHIERSITRELPHNIPFTSKVALIEKSIERWERIALDAFGQALPIVERAVRDLIAKHFGRYEESLLPSEISDICRAHIDKLAFVCKAAIRRLIALESPPSTQNISRFRSLRADNLGELRKERFPPASASSSFGFSNSIGGHSARTQPVPGPVMPPPQQTDEYEEELAVMAETRAYFQIAYERIIDSLPQTIDYDLLRPLPECIHQALLSGLGITKDGGRDKCAKYLVESSYIVAKRAELSQKLIRLSSAKEAIRDFGIQNFEENRIEVQ